MPTSRSLSKAGAHALIPLAGCAVVFLGACVPVAYVQEPGPRYVQGPAPAYYPETAAPVAPTAADPLDQLLAPVALYPDPLISILLPAAAFPSDIAAAAAYLNGGGDPGQADTQPWDPSVRALAHYPEVVKWMAQNGSWTQTVGATFVSRPADVMQAIQRLRGEARAAGTLSDSPEQQVVVQGGYVEIEPAQPDVIYVPRYDPAVVFVAQPYNGFNGPFFTYGPAYGAGDWLTFGCNWGGGGIVVVGSDYWRGPGGWRHPDERGPGRGEFGASLSANSRSWRFPSNRPRPQAPGGWQDRAQIVHPRLAAGAPAHPPTSAYHNQQFRAPAAAAERRPAPESTRQGEVREQSPVTARAAAPEPRIEKNQGTRAGGPAPRQQPKAEKTKGKAKAPPKEKREDDKRPPQ